MRFNLLILFSIAVSPSILVSTAFAEPEIITEPLMRYGLGTVADANYSPDGKYIATAGPLGIVLWDTNSFEVIRVLEYPGHSVRAIDFSPDSSQILTGGIGGKILLWEVAGSDAPIAEFEVEELVRLQVDPEFIGGGYEMVEAHGR